MVKRYLRRVMEDGISESYHKNGQLKSREQYKGGVKNGPSEWYYDNGQLGSKGQYKDGEREGVWEEYLDNGHLERKDVYADGKPIKKNIETSYNTKMLTKATY